MMKEQLKKDLDYMGIGEEQNITARYVTAKYKKLV